MSRFTPLLLFLVLAAAVYLPQSGERPETVGVDAANVAEITTEGSVKERSAEVAKPIEPKPVNVVTSADAADKPVEVSRTPDISSAANAPGEDARTEIKDAAAAEVEDMDVVIADAEQSEAGHIPSAANSDEIGPALRKLSLIDLKTSAQEHLARLGCYGAGIDGIWGEQSRASLQAFNKRVDGNWTEPSVELIDALRAAPAAICERDCVADAAGNACAVASKPAPEATDEGDASARSYLPPWMRGKELASTAPDTLAASPSSAADAAKPARRTAKRSRNRRSADRYRARERRRTYRRNRDWAPKGWPHSSR